MKMKCLRMQPHLTTALALSLGLAAVPSSAARTVKNAVIDGGKLQVSGTSTKGSKIKLDNAFSTPISGGEFNFNIDNYHPDDCVVSLKTKCGQRLSGQRRCC